ncbi:hypothetical protein JCM11641_005666 [Rhodosporidiobolus odoratus]
MNAASQPKTTPYNAFHDAVRELHCRLSPHNVNPRAYISQGLSGLLSIIDEPRWSTFPRRFRAGIVYKVKNYGWRAAVDAPRMNSMLTAPLLADVAWYERQIWAINQYATFSGSGQLALARQPLFIVHEPKDLDAAFPLLPISQEYTFHSWERAMNILREHALSLFGSARNFAGWIRDWETIKQQASNVWHQCPPHTRQRLSRAVWNSFVWALYYEDISPGISYMLNEQLPERLPPAGGALALPVDALRPPPWFPFTEQHQGLTRDNLLHAVQVTLQDAVGLKSLSLDQVDPLIQRFETRLDACGGWDRLGDERSATLIRELGAISALLQCWRGMPGVVRIFECINEHPLDNVCIQLEQWSETRDRALSLSHADPVLLGYCVWSDVPGDLHHHAYPAAPSSPVMSETSEEALTPRATGVPSATSSWLPPSDPYSLAMDIDPTSTHPAHLQPHASHPLMYDHGHPHSHPGPYPAYPDQPTVDVSLRGQSQVSNPFQEYQSLARVKHRLGRGRLQAS